MQEQSDKQVRPKVLVTGFGPFGNHKVNASWEAVKALPIKQLEQTHNVEIITAEIPVSYAHVSTEIPRLLKLHNPLVVLHLGVNSTGKKACLRIEWRAHSTGYAAPDVDSQVRDETGIEPRVLETGFDVKELCKLINDKAEETGCRAYLSDNAGRFLCEFIFYNSLCTHSSCTLFVHVPMQEICSSEICAKGVAQALSYMIENKKCKQ